VEEKGNAQEEVTMCPFCLATAAWIAAAAVSTGGMTALVVKKVATGTSRENNSRNYPIEGGSQWLAPSQNVEHPKVVSHAEWLAARKEFLKKEKEFTHLRDELSRQRRELPWEKVEKEYVFDGPKGKVDAGRSLRRPQPAHRLSLHVWSGMERGLPELLLPRRSLRRPGHSPGQSRCDFGGDFARAHGGD
jgi:hypothetical protein